MNDNIFKRNFNRQILNGATLNQNYEYDTAARIGVGNGAGMEASRRSQMADYDYHQKKKDLHNRQL